MKLRGGVAPTSIRFSREDLLDLERVRDLRSVEILVDLLKERVGSTTSYCLALEGFAGLGAYGQACRGRYSRRTSTWRSSECAPIIRQRRAQSARRSRSITSIYRRRGAGGQRRRWHRKTPLAGDLQREMHPTGTLHGVLGHPLVSARQGRSMKSILRAGSVDDNVKADHRGERSTRSVRPLARHLPRFFPAAEALQVVKELTRAKSNAERTLRMVPAMAYLSTVSFCA